MSRRTNVINNILTMAITVALIFLSAYLCNKFYYVDKIFSILHWFIIGALLFGLINAFVHEFGHIIAGKKNSFKFISMTVWFFKWSKKRKKIVFDFVFFGEEAGSTEMLPVGTENLAKRFKSMTMGGIIASLIMTLISIPPLFLSAYLPEWLYCILAMCLPLSAYYFVGSVLPMTSEGARNDGAVVLGLNKNDDISKVTVNLLAIHAELFAGKTPSEIDKSLYFDLPQLAEDELNFILLYNARYNYYLDAGDYENAKKISDRLMGIIDDIPKSIQPVIKTDALYNSCTFDFSETRADELMSEVEKYLNSDNGLTAVRVKLAYLLYIRREKDCLDMFYDKGVKDAKKHPIKGLGLFEKKLLDKMKTDFEN
ncbi:MAG: hypothetical protein E7369_03220 [Clostridiales bacterium]|nr:hypothetical protein [Clostridiales bacterium]